MVEKNRGPDSCSYEYFDDNNCFAFLQRQLYIQVGQEAISYVKTAIITLNI